jgi:hypothetical protein
MSEAKPWPLPPLRPLVDRGDLTPEQPMTPASIASPRPTPPQPKELHQPQPQPQPLRKVETPLPPLERVGVGQGEMLCIPATTAGDVADVAPKSPSQLSPSPFHSPPMSGQYAPVSSPVAEVAPETDALVPGLSLDAGTATVATTTTTDATAVMMEVDETPSLEVPTTPAPPTDVGSATAAAAWAPSQVPPPPPPPSPSGSSLADALKEYLQLQQDAAPIQIVTRMRKLLNPTLEAESDANEDADTTTARMRQSWAWIIDEGWVPRLLGWCEDPSNLVLQHECAWLLSNLASISDREAQRVIDYGGFATAVLVLQRAANADTSAMTKETKRHTSLLVKQVMWLLRNLAANGPAACQRALNSGVLTATMLHMRKTMEGITNLTRFPVLEMLQAFVRIPVLFEALELFETSAAMMVHLAQHQPMHTLVRAAERQFFLVFSGCLAMPMRLPDELAENEAYAPVIATMRSIIKRGALGIRQLLDSSAWDEPFPDERYTRALETVAQDGSAVLLNRLHTQLVDAIAPKGAHAERLWQMVYVVMWAWAGLSFGPPEVVQRLLDHEITNYFTQLVGNPNMHKDAVDLREHVLCGLHNLINLEVPPAEGHASADRMVDDLTSDILPATAGVLPEWKARHVTSALGSAKVMRALIGTMQMGVEDQCALATGILHGLARYADAAQKATMVQLGALHACKLYLSRASMPRRTTVAEFAVRPETSTVVQIVADLAGACIAQRTAEPNELSTRPDLCTILTELQEAQTSQHQHQLAATFQNAVILLSEMYARPTQKASAASKRGKNVGGDEDASMSPRPASPPAQKTKKKATAKSRLAEAERAAAEAAVALEAANAAVAAAASQARGKAKKASAEEVKALLEPHINRSKSSKAATKTAAAAAPVKPILASPKPKQLKVKKPLGTPVRAANAADGDSSAVSASSEQPKKKKPKIASTKVTTAPVSQKKPAQTTTVPKKKAAAPVSSSESEEDEEEEADEEEDDE